MKSTLLAKLARSQAALLSWRRFALFNQGGWGKQPEDKGADDSKDAAHANSQDNKDTHTSNQDQPPTPKPPKKDNEPPDLEEVWRDFNQKLQELFGGKPKRPTSADLGPKRGGSNGSGSHQNGSGNGFKLPFPDPSAGLNSLIVVVVAVVGLLWAATGFYIVQEGQVAVVSQFGKYHGTSGAGLHWRLPYPIQEQATVDISKVRKVEVGTKSKNSASRLKEALMLTDDENIVDVQFEVQFRIRENGAPGYLFSNVKPEESVLQAAESAMREEVGRRTIDEVLNVGRLEIARAVERRIQTILDRYKIRRADVDKEEYFDTGILITAVAIQNAQPPEQVQAAFDDAVKAVQDKERQINEGQAYANDVVPRAKGAASRLVSEAQGYKQRVIQSAEGDAARFKSIVTEYAKAPGVTRQRMYLETMQTVFESTSKVLVDTRSSSMLYLPLDKIIAQTAAQTQRALEQGAQPTSTLPAAATSTAPAANTVVKEPSLRSRELR